MDARKKIVFVLPALTAGGAEMVLIRLMNALDTKKFQPFFITATNKGRLREFIKPSIPFQTLNSLHVVTGLPKLHAALKKIQPDTVISTLAPANFAVLLLKPFFPKTCFIVRESSLPRGILHGRGPLKPLIRLLYRHLYPKADLVLAPAQIILDHLHTELHLPRDNMQVLPNPVDEQKITTSVPPSSPAVQFIAVGRLHFEKGFDRLIEALSAWQNRNNWHLKILGEGPKKQNLENLIRRHKLETHVTLAGFHKNPVQEVAQAHHFLLPSRWEGSPNAALESLACGTKIIALKEAGGIVEIAAEAPLDAVILCDGIPDMLKKMESAENYAKSGLSLLPSRYRRDSVVAQFEQILAQLKP